MTVEINPTSCKLCQWDTEETKLLRCSPVGLSMSLDVGFHQLRLAKTFVLPRSQLWFPVMLPDIHTLDKPMEHDTKINIRDARLAWILSFRSPSVSTSKSRQQQLGGSQSGSPAAPLPVSSLYQFNGIPTMSAITSGLEKPTKGFSVLLEDNTESRRCNSWRKNKMKRLRWKAEDKKTTSAKVDLVT